MCIRDRAGGACDEDFAGHDAALHETHVEGHEQLCGTLAAACLLYTSDAADERSSVDLGGRRIIKKKNCTHDV